MTVAAHLPVERYRPYQLLRIHATVRTAEDVHVYLPPTPDGYVALNFSVEGPGPLDTWPVRLPDGARLHLPALGETFRVNEGTVRATLPFTIKRQLGDVTVRLRVRYQACAGSLCHPPAEHVFEFHLQGEDLVGTA